MKKSESFKSLTKNKLTANETDLSSKGEDINSESEDGITFPLENNSKESANETDLSSEGEDINSESEDERIFPPEDNSKESAAAKLRKSLKVEQEALGKRIKSCGLMFSTKLEEYGMLEAIVAKIARDQEITSKDLKLLKSSAFCTGFLKKFEKEISVKDIEEKKTLEDCESPPQIVMQSSK